MNDQELMLLEREQGAVTTRGGHPELQWQNQCKNVRSVAVSTYAVGPRDDLISCSVTCTVTLPKATRGREIIVNKTFTGGSVTVVPQGTDTILSGASVVISVQWTSLHFKAINGNWIII